MLLAIPALLLVGVIVSLASTRPLKFDLRDSTTLELLKAGVATNHTAFCGSLAQRCLYRVFGNRLSFKYVGYVLDTSAQNHIDGTLGILVRHQKASGEPNFASAHNLKIKRLHANGREELLFLSSSLGECGLWEMAIPKDDRMTFIIENSRAERVGQFELLKEQNGEFSFVVVRK